MKIRIFCRLNVMNYTLAWQGVDLTRPEVRGKWIGIPSSEKKRILEGLNMPDDVKEDNDKGDMNDKDNLL